jgi:hypothetical protein
MIIAGVAFLLMGKGLGRNSATVALRWALWWGLFTTACEAVININIPIASTVVEYVWVSVQLLRLFANVGVNRSMTGYYVVPILPSAVVDAPEEAISETSNNCIRSVLVLFQVGSCS